jgi:hypothetical protein
MKKLFENWKKYINESEVADAAGDLEDALRKQAEEEAERLEKEEKEEKEQDKAIKNAQRDINQQNPTQTS